MSEQRFKAARQCDLDCGCGAKGGERCQRKGVFGRALPCGRDAELDSTPAVPSEQEYIYRVCWISKDGERGESNWYEDSSAAEMTAQLAGSALPVTVWVERAPLGSWERVEQ